MQKIRYNKRKSNFKRKDDSTWFNKILESGLGKIVLLGVSILMLLSVYRSSRQMTQKISLLNQAEQEVRELRLENLALSLEIEQAGTIDNLEKEARDRLNYGKEDEIVFVIDDSTVQLGKERVEDILYPMDEDVKVDVFDQWIDFVIEGY